MIDDQEKEEIAEEKKEERSKKYVVTNYIIFGAMIMPVLFSKFGVTDTVTLAALALMGSVGVSYGIVQGKIDLEKEKQ